jgi:ADP-heptose:LPS heptosyltransferase
VHHSLTASTPLKEWPLENWTQLARQLRQERPDLCLVCTGSEQPRERARLEAFAAALGQPPIQTFLGLPIPRLAALLSRCSLHVGADSGVLHLAMALGLRTVSLFRRYPGLEEWAPQGPGHRRVSVDCPCATQKHPPCGEAGVARCLAEVSADTVAKLVREQVSA